MGLGYVNGKFVSLDELVIPIEERGHQFGDGVYEVIHCYNGKPFMLDEHIERLIRSCEAIKLPITQTFTDFQELILTGVENAQLDFGKVYLQITRGIAPRNHPFPNVPVSITMTLTESAPTPVEMREQGVSAITHEDERWAKCYIKSLNLLPNILAKQVAQDQGSFEAILVRDGSITEGTSSNVYIVKNGDIITTPLSNHILAGITRIAVKQAAKELDIPFVEKNYSPDELLQADEVFMSNTSIEILPIVTVDGQKIGNGVPGEITNKLYSQYQVYKQNQS
ncbi:D-amino-acid transaminase [Robertmurraya kyonggiensis]|uniref:D-alanine aminotransferase n=1 Tax=Robertmurraya kyonggiensis TaxID=1037680 RepID=A0A4U1D8P0_9BACI|nr:D-amino-acid transaminase [Robertmurraya kyonggiensis]TKC18804.1 D-amino-acid transaminase [Robertmurraya kyonggiensis]